MGLVLPDPVPYIRVMKTLLRALLIASPLLLASRDAAAQCADGSPPPCGRPPAIRRTTPALRANAWIVVPFANTTRSPELDWLRDGSVNLLSLDMARWTNVIVVPDKRVADLLREVPATRAAGPLALSDGIALARRAGASMLVMGDFFRTGTGARVAANVFDVQSGARVRTVTKQTAQADSLLHVFSELARAVLAVPPPPDAKTGDPGTTNLDAYQAYLRGIRARNRMHLTESARELRQALSLDSTFALAHAALASVLGYSGPFIRSPDRRTHALAAQRFGASLPSRERALIAATVADTERAFGEMCRIVAPLVARDSTDVEALYLFAKCNQADFMTEDAGSESRTFLGNWNRSLWASRAILDADPGFYPAFDRILDILSSPLRPGCVNTPCGPLMSVFVLWTADSLDIRYHSARAANEERSRRFDVERPDLANLAVARRIAEDWYRRDPGPYARQGLAEVRILEGDASGAYAVLHRGPVEVSPENASGIRLAFELAFKTGRAKEARAWLDTLMRVAPDGESPSLLFAHYELALGRTERFERLNLVRSGLPVDDNLARATTPSIRASSSVSPSRGSSRPSRR